MLEFKGGNPVLVGSDTLLVISMEQGLAYDEYCYGGKYCGTTFLLDENDNLTVFTAEDRASSSGRTRSTRRGPLHGYSEGRDAESLRQVLSGR